MSDLETIWYGLTFKAAWSIYQSDPTQLEACIYGKWIALKKKVWTEKHLLGRWHDGEIRRITDPYKFIEPELTSVRCCANCHFFEHNRCKRHAPTMGNKMNKPEWPEIMPDDFCGDWEVNMHTGTADITDLKIRRRPRWKRVLLWPRFFVKHFRLLKNGSLMNRLAAAWMLSKGIIKP